MPHNWLWESEAPKDEGRLKRAAKVKVDHLTITEDECSAVFIGSEGTPYATTLEACSCPDFALKHGTIPCKHILRLAMEARIINANGNTPAQQLAADREALRSQIAAAYGYYYHFHAPVMSDQAYDKLKDQLSKVEARILENGQ